eukprot:TRINITY_DN117_c0_g1_i1.p1 TRINITY_DN117_c0_g1~~TRINITY_DN117_c0_g1_i1.p1  ORF type:complete len:507 (-),score=77.21 TRINITY_DN117_c0_g1_i1:198-1718(-)
MNQGLHIEFSILLFAVENAISFNSLESCSWEYLCQAMKGGLFASGQTLLRSRLNVAYKVASELSAQLFEAAPVVAVIVDTAKLVGSNLLSISYQAVERLPSQLVIHTKTLDYVNVTGESKTAEFLQQQITAKARSRLGTENKISAYVTDGAPNMEKAATGLGSDEKWIWCMSHRLALVLKDMGKLSCLKKDFELVQALSTGVRNNEAQKKAFKEVQIRLGKKPLSLVLSIETRFASKYFQIARVLECKEELIQLRRSDITFRPLVPDTGCFSRLQAYAELMEPIVEVLRFAEGDKLTLSAMPKKLYTLVELRLPEIQVYTALEPVKRALISSLKTRMEDVYTKVGYPILAALCHPAYASLSWLPKHSLLREDAWSRFLDEAYAAQETKTNLKISKEELEGTIKRLRKHFDHKDAKTEDPLTFWTNPENNVLHLIPVVQKFLCVPPSSATAERSFSSTKFLQKGRPQLKPENLGKVAVVRNFMKQPLYNHREFITKLVQEHLKSQTN